MISLSYITDEIWNEHGDDRVLKLPFMNGGPLKVMMIVSIYLLFVKYLGPKYMSKRKEFDLRPVILIYNSLLVGFNGIGFIFASWITSNLTTTWDCSLFDKRPTFRNNVFIYFGWLYFISKFVDLFDTIFFVLRKKNTHVTTLHVFHHSVMPLIAWFGLKFHPSDYSGFLPTLNSLIHMMMYSYYALACAGPECKKYLWWKRHITEAQMIQFILTFFHSLNAILTPNCCWPKWLAILEGLHAIIFLFMFSLFYKNAYFKKPIKNE